MSPEFRRKLWIGNRHLKSCDWMGSPSKRMSIEKRRDLRTGPGFSHLWVREDSQTQEGRQWKMKDKRKTKRQWLLSMSEGKKGRAVSQVPKGLRRDHWFRHMGLLMTLTKVISEEWWAEARWGRFGRECERWMVDRCRDHLFKEFTIQKTVRWGSDWRGNVWRR